MSDITPNAEPVVEPPVAPVEPVVEPVVPAEESVHPAWQRTFDEAGIPDMLRPKLIEQVRRTEAEYNRGIEAAKKSAVPDDWKQFLENAQQAGATPGELTTSWNAAQAIRENPIAFLDNFAKQVDQLVASGQLTRAEGAAKKQEAVDGVNDTVDLTSPEAAKIAQMEQTIQQMQGDQTKQQQAAAQRQAIADSEAYADHFMNTINAALPKIGVTGNPAEDAVANQMQGIVGRIADSMIANDPTGRMTPEQAVDAALQQVAAATGRTVGAAPATTAAGIPVHGGGAATTPPVPRKFANQAEREAAMLEVGRSFQQ